MVINFHIWEIKEFSQLRANRQKIPKYGPNQILDSFKRGLFLRFQLKLDHQN